MAIPVLGDTNSPTPRWIPVLGGTIGLGSVWDQFGDGLGLVWVRFGVGSGSVPVAVVHVAVLLLSMLQF